MSSWIICIIISSVSIYVALLLNRNNNAIKIENSNLHSKIDEIYKIDYKTEYEVLKNRFELIKKDYENIYNDNQRILDKCYNCIVSKEKKKIWTYWS